MFLLKITFLVICSHTGLYCGLLLLTHWAQLVRWSLFLIFGLLSGPLSLTQSLYPTGIHMTVKGGKTCSDTESLWGNHQVQTKPRLLSVILCPKYDWFFLRNVSGYISLVQWDQMHSEWAWLPRGRVSAPKLGGRGFKLEVRSWQTPAVGVGLRG